MPEPLKNLYNEAFFEELSEALNAAVPNYDHSQFLTDIFDDSWEGRELKERMSHIAEVMGRQLPNNFKEAAALLMRLTDDLMAKHGGMEFTYMFIPEYIEKNGLDDLQTSCKAMEKITQFTSCEFAVRPFIIEYPKEMMAQLLTWSKHPHENVRRFASEGCRPRLPWAMALPELKKDPAPILPILENLKDDPSEFVRRSVANNLNDIAKDNPRITIAIANRWHGMSTNTDKLVKHACRTLLKQAEPQIMALFGFGNSKDVSVTNLSISNTNVRIGEYLNFEFEVHNTSTKACKIRLEYAIHYLKANGSLSKKVFMISEKDYPANSVTKVQRKQSFKLISTRKFHVGGHKLSVIVNGKEFQQSDFELIA